MFQVWLDQLFPFVALVYGVTVVICLHGFMTPELERRAVAQNPAWADHLTRLRAHLPLAYVSAIIGGLWILQRLWLSEGL
jgi:hypothetical protein